MATYKILIPLDGSDLSRQALPHMCHLFDPKDYEVVLFRAAEAPAGVALASPRDSAVGGVLMSASVLEDIEQANQVVYASQAWETAEAALKDELLTDAKCVRYAGYKVSTVVRFGEPAAEIAACVENMDIDLVIMATHGWTGFRRLLLGSVAEQVLRRLQVPVMLVRPG
jgi:nucleotide-binding universal stress UspA family protein